MILNFLPSFKRVKCASSSNKSGPFLGSGFSYEDIATQEVDKYKYRNLQDEQVMNRDTFVIERFPEYKNSGDKRQIVWIDKRHYQSIITEFYDRKNALLKTLTFHDDKQYLSKYWRPARLEMRNHQKKEKYNIHMGKLRFRNKP